MTASSATAPAARLSLNTGWLGCLRPAPLIALAVVLLLIAMAILAPWLAPHDPLQMTPSQRLKAPSGTYLLGTDAFGRDLLSRVMHGARISLLAGLGVAVASIAIGLPLGLMSGFFRTLDAVMMRIMDGLMAIPSVLLAIAVVSLTGASLTSLIVAITLPEVPRVVRLVRSVVLSAREELYVEAAISLGSSLPRILRRHLLPNTLAPLIVQGTYICASAILTEAILSFLGAGIGTEIPSWGNIIAEGRMYFQLKPALIFWPGLVLSACVLAINLLGDAARDMLDPKLRQRGGH
ncbi:MAG: ABC transporter permease [Burkholderiaceae bacterium]|nr:ABC transporter permease [Burkholderiaceae bacterium]